MNIERLRRIIEYNNANKEYVESKIKRFYAYTGMDSDSEVLNIMQIARPFCKEMGYLVLELPFADEEIGALCYRGDALGYIVLNTSLPKVNVNFALCHELYHVFCQQNQFKTKLEFANDGYYESEEESAANLFAGMLLMPENGFRRMYAKFKAESEDSEKDTIIKLMSYYQAPYMSVLIRCYELDLITKNRVSEKMLQGEMEEIKKKFHELWLDSSVLEATQKDDYCQIEAVVQRLGQEYIRDAYLNNRTLDKVLKNMKDLYSEIREG